MLINSLSLSLSLSVAFSLSFLCFFFISLGYIFLLFKSPEEGVQLPNLAPDPPMQIIYKCQFDALTLF